jgi:hypothetical protein
MHCLRGDRAAARFRLWIVAFLQGPVLRRLGRAEIKMEAALKPGAVQTVGERSL